MKHLNEPNNLAVKGLSQTLIHNQSFDVNNYLETKEVNGILNRNYYAERACNCTC